MQRIRLLALFVVLGALAGACGAADVQGAPVTTAATVASGETPATTVAAAAPDTAETPVTSAVARGPSGVDGPAAPDFSLVLGDGSTFVLSDESKPVYLVFWAEW